MSAFDFRPSALAWPPLPLILTLAQAHGWPLWRALSPISNVSLDSSGTPGKHTRGLPCCAKEAVGSTPACLQEGPAEGGRRGWADRWSCGTCPQLVGVYWTLTLRPRDGGVVLLGSSSWGPLWARSGVPWASWWGLESAPAPAPLACSAWQRGCVEGRGGHRGGSASTPCVPCVPCASPCCPGFPSPSRMTLQL